MVERRRTPTLRRGAASVLAVLLACAAAACRTHEATSAPSPPTVTVVRPEPQPVADAIELTGNTAPSQSATLVARVEGYLEKIHVPDGAWVDKGALLFTIQQDQYRAQLREAEAQVAAQKAALVHAKTELKRYENLVREDSAPQTQVDRWRYERDSAAAALIAAEAQVELARLNLSYTEVRAPFAGRMGRHLIDAGNLVGGVGQPSNLAQLDQTDPLYVYFTLDERDVLRILEQHRPDPERPLVERKIPVFFGLLDEQGYPHEGTLDFASLGVAPTTGTLQVRGVFPNPGSRVLPGLFVRVRVPLGAPQPALTVPGEAIRFDQQGEYVLVVGADDVVARRGVTTGAQLGDRFVVTSGLSADDRVISEGLARAVPGRKVTPVEAGAPASGA